MRLDKYLSHVGLGTRKTVKQLIKQKDVTVNGVVAKKGDMTIDEQNDTICYQGELLHYQQFYYVLLHKPAGVISATEDDKHKTVLDLLPPMYQHLFPVGRLDKDTEGLLLLTNDGQLAHQLLSPKKHVNKTYYVELQQPLKKEAEKLVNDGLVIDGGYQCLSATIERITNTTCYITIQEGKFHQVKRMFNALDNTVTYLKRVSMGPLTLPDDLKKGMYRLLNDDEMAKLFHGFV